MREEKRLRSLEMWKCSLETWNGDVGVEEFDEDTVTSKTGTEQVGRFGDKVNEMRTRCFFFACA